MLGAARCVEARDKKEKEKYGNFSSVKYAVERRTRMFEPHTEPRMQ